MPAAPRARFILASGSPRRRSLIAGLGLEFEAVPADIDETPAAGEAPDALAERLSAAKAAAVGGRFPEALVIAADTVVAVEGEILGKPAGAAENARFLRLLSGRTHSVHTGHTLALGGRSLTRVVTTRVTFRTLLDREISWYAATGEGLDKAGGYGIQGKGSALVESICGCYFNVMGLSVSRVIAMARQVGVELV